jgi:hypothetical protein
MIVMVKNGQAAAFTAVAERHRVSLQRGCLLAPGQVAGGLPDPRRQPPETNLGSAQAPELTLTAEDLVALGCTVRRDIPRRWRRTSSPSRSL